MGEGGGGVVFLRVRVGIVFRHSQRPMLTRCLDRFRIEKLDCSVLFVVAVFSWVTA